MTTNYIDLAVTENDSGEWDLVLDQQDLVLEDGLESACVVSLFTDARVTPDELPPGQTDLGGWWGDAVDDTGDRIGSKLWLLEGAAPNQETLAKAIEYGQDALQWMISDGVAQTVTVDASFSTNEELLIQVEIVRPDGRISNFEFSYAWAQQLQKGT